MYNEGSGVKSKDKFLQGEGDIKSEVNSSVTTKLVIKADNVSHAGSNVPNPAILSVEADCNQIISSPSSPLNALNYDNEASQNENDRVCTPPPLNTLNYDNEASQNENDSVCTPPPLNTLNYENEASQNENDRVCTPPPSNTLNYDNEASQNESDRVCTPPSDNCEIEEAVTIVKQADSGMRQCSVTCAVTEARYEAVNNETQEACLNILESSDMHLEDMNDSFNLREQNESREGNTQHPTEYFQCETCFRRFTSNAKLSVHFEQHSKPLLKCSHCSYTTTSSKLLNYHQNIHSEKYKCKICNKFFTRKIYLKSHIKDIHHNVRRLHNCEECSAKFLSLSGLKMHTQTAHERASYACSLCNYKGKCTNNLSIHMARTHKKKYKCTSCVYETLTQSALDRHAKIYHSPDVRQFACKYCSYRGQKQRQLLDHERTVHGQTQNRHICPICKKSFRTQVMMKQHLPSHTDLQLFACKGCSYRTRFRQTLHLHIKNSHPGESFKTLGKSPSEADFENIIQAALQNLESFPSYIDQTMEIEYVTQVPENSHVIEDSNNVFNVPTTSATLFSEEKVNSEEENLSNHELTVTSEASGIILSNTELISNTGVNKTVVHDLSVRMDESNETVTVIDNSNLVNSEVRTVVNLSDIRTYKEEVQSLFPLNSFNIEDGKIHQVVTLVDTLDPASGTNQQSVMLLKNIVQDKAAEHDSITHISLLENHNPCKENLMILPLGNSNVAIIQNENFSTIQSNNHLVLDEQTALLDLIPEQNVLMPQNSAETVNNVTVYHLNQ